MSDGLVHLFDGDARAPPVEDALETHEPASLSLDDDLNLQVTPEVHPVTGVDGKGVSDLFREGHLARVRDGGNRHGPR